jgi:hypothetical protein
MLRPSDLLLSQSVSVSNTATNFQGTSKNEFLIVGHSRPTRACTLCVCVQTESMCVPVCRCVQADEPVGLQLC